MLPGNSLMIFVVRPGPLISARLLQWKLLRVIVWRGLGTLHSTLMMFTDSLVCLVEGPEADGRIASHVLILWVMLRVL